MVQPNKFFKKLTGEASVKKGSMGEGEAHSKWVLVFRCFKSCCAILSRKKHGYKLSSKERPTSQDHSNFCQNLLILGSFYVSGNVSISSSLANVLAYNCS